MHLAGLTVACWLLFISTVETSVALSPLLPRVVVIGGGFAGLNAAMTLPTLFPCNVTLLDPSPRFTFTPLLYEYATGALKLDDVAPTFSDLLKSSKDTNHLPLKVTGIDLLNKVVKTESRDHHDDTPLPYDYLLISPGPTGPSAPIPDTSPGSVPPPLVNSVLPFRTLSDADRLLRKLRSLPPTLSVAVVGGGFSGVELATNLRSAHPSAAITLYHGGAALLPAAQEGNRRAGAEAVARSGVRVLLSTRVGEISLSDDQAMVDGEPFDVIVWTAATGTPPIPPFTSSVVTDSRLRVVDPETGNSYRTVFALGDAAKIPSFPDPSTAQTAMAQANTAAYNVYATEKKQKLLPFKYTSLGEMVTLGGEGGSISSLGGKVNLDGPLGGALRRLVYNVRMPRAKLP